MLHDDAPAMSHLEQLHATFANGGAPAPPTEFERGDNHTFANAYYNKDFFWEKCFVSLYPFGRGGPSDPNIALKMSLKTYANHSLRQGYESDERRHQSNPYYIFAMYQTEVHRNCGTVALLMNDRTEKALKGRSQKVNAADFDNANPEDGEAEAPDSSAAAADENLAATAFPKLSQEKLDEIIAWLKKNEKKSKKSVSERASAAPPTAEEAAQDEAIQRIVNSMVPYGSIISGTPLHMALERKKLLAQISSQTVLAEGIWRWFITMAPADVYDSKLYDIATNHLSNNMDIVDRMDKLDRTEMLRNHPALSARLFDIKQDAIWEKLIGGETQPFGQVLDFWRRVEVGSCVRIHCKIRCFTLIVITTFHCEFTRGWVCYSLRHGCAINFRYIRSFN